MSSGEVACDFFVKLCHGWFVSALDACSHLSGTLVAWNPLLVDFKEFKTCAGLLLIGKLKGLEFYCTFS